MKKRLIAFIFSCLLLVQLFAVPTFAAETQPVSPVQKTRSNDEIAELKEIYATLFPDAYHYIEEYEAYGVSDEEYVDIIYSEYIDYDNKTYGLIVMSNGQIFTNITEYSNTRATNRYATLQVGDLGDFILFGCTYQINPGYDKIIECKEVENPDGVLIYDFELKKKYTEDSSSPAYHIYTNSVLNNEAASRLYDLGVAVGNDQVRGIATPASGLDMFLWQFFYAFFPGPGPNPN